MAKRKSFNIGSSLSQALTDTAQAAENYKGDLYVEVIPLRRVEMDPDNPREFVITIADLLADDINKDEYYEQKQHEKSSLESLAKSIEEQGVINPILVYQYNDHYRLIAGERRTLASVMIGKKDIPARILPNKPTQLKVSLLQWIENMERADLSLWERVQNIQKISQAYAKENEKSLQDVTILEIAQLIGVSKTQGSLYKHLLHAPTNLLTAIKENRISNLKQASYLANLPNNLLDNMIEKCNENISIEELKQSVELAMADTQKIQIVKVMGRPSNNVNLGSTSNINVVKLIIQAIASNKDFKYLNNIIQKINWEDKKTVTKAFKEIIAKLETEIG